MEKSEIRSAMMTIVIVSLLTIGCSDFSKNPQSFLGSSISETSEADDGTLQQSVFDPFYDAVSTAMSAAKQTQTAQTDEEWRAIAEQWQAAIEMMKAVPVSHPKYTIAQQRAFEQYPHNFQYAQSKAGTQAIPELTTDDGKLTEIDFGQGWPFLVDGELSCERENTGNYSISLVTLTSIGETFAVNESAQARARERDWQSIQEIWRDSPNGDGKAPMTWVIMRGEALCPEENA